MEIKKQYLLLLFLLLLLGLRFTKEENISKLIRKFYFNI